MPDLAVPLSVFFFLLGTVLGSFGNVIALRVPEGRSIGGRSGCPKCKRTLAPLELLPIASFLGLRGRCRGCHARISWQYPLVELASGLLFLWALWQDSLAIAPAFLLGAALWLLLLIALIDARTSLIPDALTLSLIGIATLHASLTLSFPLTAIILGGGVFALQWFFSRGRWVGSGDMLLGAGIGALAATLPLTLVALFCAYIAGAAVAAYMLITKRRTLEGALPFAPFLAFGGFIAVCAGQALLQFLLG